MKIFVLSVAFFSCAALCLAGDLCESSGQEPKINESWVAFFSAEYDSPEGKYIVVRTNAGDPSLIERWTKGKTLYLSSLEGRVRKIQTELCFADLCKALQVINSRDDIQVEHGSALFFFLKAYGFLKEEEVSDNNLVLFGTNIGMKFIEIPIEGDRGLQYSFEITEFPVSPYSLGFFVNWDPINCDITGRVIDEIPNLLKGTGQNIQANIPVCFDAGCFTLKAENKRESIKHLGDLLKRFLVQLNNAAHGSVFYDLPTEREFTQALKHPKECRYPWNDDPDSRKFEGDQRIRDEYEIHSDGVTKLYSHPIFKEITECGKMVPFGANLVYHGSGGLRFVCWDLYPKLFCKNRTRLDDYDAQYITKELGESSVLSSAGIYVFRLVRIPKSASRKPLYLSL